MLTSSHGYPTVDDLLDGAREVVVGHPGVSTLRTLGRTRGGEPLTLLTVGDADGSAGHAVVVGGPHANEPVGGATALHLAALLAGDPALRHGLAWHFLLCLDPEGSRLNEGWLTDPGDPADYFRGMYRPVTERQPEWLPQAGAEPLPETAALVGVLDELRPVAQFSLHANDVGGTWVQTTADLPGLSARFAKVAAELDVPLETAPFDAFHMPSPAPGIFVMPGPGPESEGRPLNDLSARSTWFHPVRYGTVTVLVEAPQWTVPEIADDTPLDDPQAAVDWLVAGMRARTTRLAELFERARPWLDPVPGRLQASARWVIDGCFSIADEWHAGLGSRAGRARLARSAGSTAALRMIAQRLPLRGAGMLARSLAGRRGAEGARRAVLAQLDAWYTEFEAEHKPRWLPVRDQVELQSQAVLSAAAELTGDR
ncbi:hypothetical protein SRB5_22610 [Streptomyces sp. RB5]|uniref:Peptidase M14 domain-containing protein n=1 Tax=Streptomyces smaragdinus TaxID=2585196 RepID=A0A7K0CF87_9ACTN|nr:M14 family zinc carboxypeptidase [Streptomyces smaragdinus]MQY12131.1 hypothetical protein [Streptomyces smaragdinus]